MFGFGMGWTDSLPPVRLHEDVFEHVHLPEDVRERKAAYILSQETVELMTVGIDIGSSTSHLLFAKIHLERERQRSSSRFVVVHRDIVWRSPIMLTPFTEDGLIDAVRLARFIKQSYADAGIEREDVDSGAVILTGEAIKRRNAQAIDQLFADEAGKFVCATAGHRLEATLAAYGSGAVRLSRERQSAVLHVDIGGGTTKLALIDQGKILSVAAFAVGGRLIARDDRGIWSRIDDAARTTAEDLGIPADPAFIGLAENRRRIAERLADILVDYIDDTPRDPLGKALLLTDELQRTVTPTAITVSGGVAEYLFGRERGEFGDIAKPLAAEIRERLRRRVGAPVYDPGIGIRATVIGASQFTVQVSGKTIYLSDPSLLPLRNVPVVHLDIPQTIDPIEIDEALRAAFRRLDAGAHSPSAIAFSWNRDPEHADLSALCRGITRAFADAPTTQPLVLLVDGDVGKNLGHLLRDELGWHADLIAVDGVELQELDFVDVGELMTPPGVVPLVIKSLVFSSSD
jgi:ethanolamine utilization protein EutA